MCVCVWLVMVVPNRARHTHTLHTKREDEDARQQKRGAQPDGTNEDGGDYYKTIAWTCMGMILESKTNKKSKQAEVLCLSLFLFFLF